MGVRFTGNGTGTSSIAFTTINLRAPIISASMPSIIDQTEILTSDAGIHSTYKSGQRQLQFDFRWNLLDNTELQNIKEFLEIIDGSNNWFTLQDHFIPDIAKDAMPQLFFSNLILSANNLISTLWSDKPIGKWGFIVGPIKNIVSSTNATPIVVTITTHGFTTGSSIKISGHTINTNANGTWIITVIDNNSFSLNGSAGNGIGGATGTASPSTINSRRRIKAYVSILATVDPVFAGNIEVNDTFIIGVPVIIMPGQIKILPRLNDRWDMAMTF